MKVGERIRYIRKQRNMTIEALAKSVGVTRQTISRYETGSIAEIPRSKLEKIADELGVKCDYLEGWTMESQRDSAQFDIQQLKAELANAKTDAEKAEIEESIFILDESYKDLCFAIQMSPVPQLRPELDKHSLENRHAIKYKVKEWHSDKKANLTMQIDSWLLLALKGMAADSNRTLTDEIEEVLYFHVMNAIDEESNRENAMR